MSYLFLILIIILIVCILVFFLGLEIYTAIIGAPFVSTPKKIIREAFKIAELKHGDKLYDLGCGNGRVLVIASKEFGAQAFGYEFSPLHYLLSKLNIYLNGCLKSAQVFWRNFYKVNIGNADVMFLWLTPKAFKKLDHKFKSELKKGTRIITYSSPLVFWKPKQIYETSNGSKLFYYLVE